LAMLLNTSNAAISTIPFHSMNKPVVLYRDNCAFHCSHEVKRGFAEHRILLITYPPHTSHVIQVLDTVLFERLKWRRRVCCKLRVRDAISKIRWGFSGWTNWRPRAWPWEAHGGRGGGRGVIVREDVLEIQLIICSPLIASGQLYIKACKSLDDLGKFEAVCGQFPQDS
jgi:hypothetical protein